MKLIPLCAGAFVMMSSTTHAQQRNDSLFDASVVHPAYVVAHPRVLIDAAHRNEFVLVGPEPKRIAPFATLLANDGYNTVTSREHFTRATLDSVQILVIVTARCAATSDSTCGSAFDDDEIREVRRWVEAGGALLLCADHFPFDASARALAAHLGVTIGDGYVLDSTAYDRKYEAMSRATMPDFFRKVDSLGRPWGGTVFSRNNGLLGQGPILSGRSETERIETVIIGGGSSITGPPGTTVLLRLSRNAWQVQSPIPWPGFSDSRKPSPAHFGNAQAVAFRLGGGRVVVVADATWLSAQRATSGPYEMVIGLSRTDTDNKQFALNIMHWLSGELR